MFRQRNVLVMVGNEWKPDDLRQIFGDYTAVTYVETLGELRVQLGRGKYDAVLCDRLFRSGSWKEILKAADEEAPGVPTIVLSKDSSGWERREAVGAGAFDLLTLPLPQQTLLAIVEQAATSQQAREKWAHPATARAVPA